MFHAPITLKRSIDAIGSTLALALLISVWSVVYCVVCYEQPPVHHVVEARR